MIDTGEPAPDFSLKDQHGEIFTLSGYRGRRVVLSFHPLAWTETCTRQMRALEENWQEFDALGAIAIGISVDSVPCKRAWAKAIDLEMTTLLADFWPHGGVAQDYGVFDSERGVAERATVVVDEFQHIIYAKRSEPGGVPDLQEVIALLREEEESRVEEINVPKI
ncbi:peroxiredoxin [Methanoculleus frigidifontis]|uniref:peroxiredoxin n=1 Tax=Methanoculleus frigidifontis TaxID=2584085 RepID=UPI00265B3ECB|nr:peroxiredoxin [Methanoculleus sp. FWC-SCC1]